MKGDSYVKESGWDLIFHSCVAKVDRKHAIFSIIQHFLTSYLI